MSQFAVILPAAGKSSRFSKNKRKKPFLELDGRAIWVRASEHFVNREDVSQTLVVVSPEDMEWFKEKFRPNLAFMDIEVVEGGAERSDSVQNALARVKSDVDYVAIHDAARPLIVSDWVTEIFEAVEKYDAVIPAVPVASTLKKVAGDQTISETISREAIYEAQTPQVFKREILLDAYAKRGDFQPTDEAQLVERIGFPVKIINGSPINIKITREADFHMAKALLKALPKPKLDKLLHPFADEDPKFLF